MGNYTEKLAKRIYLGQNLGAGCLVFFALMILLGLMFICSHSK